MFKVQVTRVRCCSLQPSYKENFGHTKLPNIELRGYCREVSRKIATNQLVASTYVLEVLLPVIRDDEGLTKHVSLTMRFSLYNGRVRELERRPLVRNQYYRSSGS
jgi:hypothetical protein